jgi:hypothetical protein
VVMSRVPNTEIMHMATAHCLFKSHTGMWHVARWWELIPGLSSILHLSVLKRAHHRQPAPLLSPPMTHDFVLVASTTPFSSTHQQASGTSGHPIYFSLAPRSLSDHGCVSEAPSSFALKQLSGIEGGYRPVRGITPVFFAL